VGCLRYQQIHFWWSQNVVFLNGFFFLFSFFSLLGSFIFIKNCQLAFSNVYGVLCTTLSIDFNICVNNFFNAHENLPNFIMNFEFCIQFLKPFISRKMYIVKYIQNFSNHRNVIINWTCSKWITFHKNMSNYVSSKLSSYSKLRDTFVSNRL